MNAHGVQEMRRVAYATTCAVEDSDNLGAFAGMLRKHLSTAALKLGVDLTDEDALATMIFAVGVVMTAEHEGLPAGVLLATLADLLVATPTAHPKENPE